MIGDRVIIGNGYEFKDNGDSVAVYQVQTEPNGKLIKAHDGSVMVTVKGGVKVGSTGTIKSGPVSVHRTQVAGDNTPTYGGKDFVQFYPVFLDHYQQLGWFPVDNLRVASGQPLY